MRGAQLGFHQDFRDSAKDMGKNFEALLRENSTGFADLQTDLYAILNLSVGSSRKEIERSYRNLSRFIHPDKIRRNGDFDNEFDEGQQEFLKQSQDTFEKI